jgi:hypothetical protein
MKLNLKKNLLLLFVFVCSLGNAKDEFGLLWEPIVVMDNQLFPSYIWANATRNIGENSEKTLSEAEKSIKGDREGQLGFKFTNLNSKAYSIKVEIESSSIMEKTVYETFADKSLVEFTIFPEIAYKFDVLKANLEPKPISVKYTVYVNGKIEGSKTQNIILRSINDCPFTFVEKDNSLKDLNFMYAAYVNENNPRIANEILPAILKQGVISSVIGYQGSKADVYKQVFAVWNYFKSKGVVYSSLNSPNQKINTEARPFIKYQFVRTLDESLNSAQANCVDGTVAMASVLYKMGIEPVILTTPNHCFLGFISDKDAGDIDFIETTSLGTKFGEEDLKAVSELDCYDSSFDSEYYTSYRSFLMSVYQGRVNYNQDKDLFNAYNAIVRFDLIMQGKENEIIEKAQYRWFTVSNNRKEGLMPISLK